MNSEEKCFLKKVIWKKAIPEPLLTIKTHKKVLANGHFDSRFIVPSDMFTAGFCKVGFKAIKAILDKHGVVYDRHNIVQARSLVSRLEGLGLRKDSVTIASVDATRMYPSIKFCMIEKAVRYFIDACERFDEDDERVLEDALEMVQFGMANSLLVFDGEYYQYTAGEDEPEDRGLTIGGYHSAWLSDLTMAWGMESVDPSVFTDTELFRFYRDDGIIIFKRKLNSLELKWWLQSFQAEFNELAESEHLQFEMVV